MANEAEIISNPDSTPGAVSTGYQAQNTRFISQSVGVDKTVVEGGTGECVLKLSGPVDVNGTLYTINTDVIFTLTTAGAYYIHLSGSGDNLSPTIGTATTYPHTFDADKNARYTDTGNYRVLNWVIYYDGTTAYAHRIITPENTKTQIEDLDTFEETWITGNGSWTAPRSKYYTFWMTGKGGNASSSTSAGSSTVECSGGSGATGMKRIFVTAGTIWTAVFSSSEDGDLSFTDGITTLTVKNANYWSGGDSSSGMDYYFKGSLGNYSSTTSTLKANGASSFYGGGGVWWNTTTYGDRASNGVAFGSGGGYNLGYAGSGKSGIIRIIG